MIDTLRLLLKIIEIDFFIAYGIYTLLIIIPLLFFSKNELLKTIDDNANKLIIFCGVLYLVFYLIIFSSNFFLLDEDSKNEFYKRLLGRHWFAYWFQLSLWVIPSQLLRIKIIRRWAIVRILFAFVFILSFEKFIIILTSLERDYLPSTWSYITSEYSFSYIEFILGVLLKIGLFIGFSYLYSKIETKVKKSLTGIEP